jgi:lipopolysaccharide transport system permease protein
MLGSVEVSTIELAHSSHDLHGQSSTSVLDQALPEIDACPRIVYLKDLLIELVSRDMKVMYKRSALGILWTLVTPLLQLLVFSFFFHAVLSINVDRYASYAFTGLLVWSWFQNSLLQSTRSIVSNRALIHQPGFPPSILPAATVTTGLVHFMLTAPALLVLFWRDGVVVSPSLLLFPLLVLLQLAFTLGLVYPLAAVSVHFQDTQHILNILLNLALHLTPIFYAVSVVPARYQWFYQLNPMLHIIDAYRAVLIQGVLPDWHSLSVVTVLTVCLLPLGYFFFKKQSRRFSEAL